jgi:hypothetical protein
MKRPKPLMPLVLSWLAVWCIAVGPLIIMNEAPGAMLSSLSSTGRIVIFVTWILAWNSVLFFAYQRFHGGSDNQQ